MSEDQYINFNRESWNRRAVVHFQSKFYDVENFIKGKSSLNQIELTELGDVSSKKILHLQCHFGQDSISLERLGAQVVGVDLSDKSIEYANLLNKKCNSNVRFINCNIYDLPQYLNEKFDIVYTSYGVIGWLFDLDKWAQIISSFLKDGGFFYMAEFHPIVWMFSYNFDRVEYSYNKKDVIIEYLNNTYADKDTPLELCDYNWNHGIGEVVNSLSAQGLRLEFLNEHEYSPYAIFADTVEKTKGQYMVKGLENMIPLVYSLKASRY